MTYTRRNALKLLGTSSLLAMSPVTLAGSSRAPEKKLKFLNLHTGEQLDAVYWAEGLYIPEALDDINHLLRDHRSNSSTRIDVSLLNALEQLQSNLGNRGEIQVVSGYRSPQTNELLRRKGHQVAKRSYHMKGQAIDICLPNISLRHVHKAALNLKAGGVGYYPKNGFIHLDTGRIRRWG